MDSLDFTGSAPTDKELVCLNKHAAQALELLRQADCEVKRPFFFEFAGAPKSGKSTIIGIVGHFLRRAGFRVVQPAEGASLRTPDALRDDWFAFNAWSASYALRHILEMAHEPDPPDAVLLDRGLFDATAWMSFLENSQGRLADTDRATINAFIKLELWRRRESAVFLFIADPETSMKRELDGKLVKDHGSVMNPQTLNSPLIKSSRHKKVAFQIAPGGSKLASFEFFNGLLKSSMTPTSPQQRRARRIFSFTWQIHPL